MADVDIFWYLKEIFPQVDVRILKAAAIEHANDVDAAAEFILSDILPSSYRTDEAFDTLDGREEARVLPSKESTMPVLMENIEKSSQDLGFKDNNEIMFYNPQYVAAYDLSTRRPFSIPCTMAKGKELADESRSLSHHHEVDILKKFSKLISQKSEGDVVAEYENGFVSKFNSDKSHVSVAGLTSYDDINGREFRGGNSEGAEKICSDVSSTYIHALQTEEARGSAPVVSSGVHFFSQENNPVIEEFDSEAEFSDIDEEPLLRRSKIDAAKHDLVDPEIFKPASTTIQEFQIKEARGSVPVASSGVQSESNPVIDEFYSETEVSDIDEEAITRRSKTNADNHDIVDSEIFNPAPTTFLLDNDIPLSIKEGIPQVSESGSSDKLNSCNLINEGPNSGFQSNISFGEATLVAVESDAHFASDKSTSLTNQSGHVVNTDHLQDIINDVKNKKEALLSAVVTVNCLMGEVEDVEDKAKQATAEAAKAGQDILSKAGEIKEAVKKAKEANDMRAGEIYGEKATLAAEGCELQCRLHSLADERDKYLSVIEETRQTLEARLAVAEKQLEEAEQEKCGKVEGALDILKEQEAIMEEVVLESKRLQQEEEQNLKLRDFLINRGHLVDAIQGEMAIMFEEILLLKGKADQHVPIKKSLESTLHSLDSSSSSTHSNSMIPVEFSESLQKTSEELPQNLQQQSFASEGKFGDGDLSKTTEDDWEYLMNACPSA